jgi:hypothetical protein
VGLRRTVKLNKGCLELRQHLSAAGKLPQLSIGATMRKFVHVPSGLRKSGRKSDAELHAARSG